MTTDNNLPYQQMIGILAEIVTTYLLKHGVRRVQFPVVLVSNTSKKSSPQTNVEIIQTILACQNFGLSFDPQEIEQAS